MSITNDTLKSKDQAAVGFRVKALEIARELKFETREELLCHAEVIIGWLSGDWDANGNARGD